MDYLKDNWKSVLVAVVVGIGVICLVCCDGKSDDAPAVEEVPVEISE